MAASLNQHFKYALTVGHATPPTGLNSLLKATSCVLLLLLLLKLLQEYRHSTGLTLDEARVMLRRPFAVLLVTDVQALHHQVTIAFLSILNYTFAFSSTLVFLLNTHFWHSLHGETPECQTSFAY